MRTVVDLEHRFHVDGRTWVVEICGCGNHPPAKPAPAFESVVYTCVPEDLLDHEDDSPDRVVRQITEKVRRRVPTSISVDQWGEFTDKLLAWVREHGADSAVREHGEDWHAGRRDLEGPHEPH